MKRTIKQNIIKEETITFCDMCGEKCEHRIPLSYITITHAPQMGVWGGGPVTSVTFGPHELGNYDVCDSCYENYINHQIDNLVYKLQNGEK